MLLSGSKAKTNVVHISIMAMLSTPVKNIIPKITVKTGGAYLPGRLLALRNCPKITYNIPCLFLRTICKLFRDSSLVHWSYASCCPPPVPSPSGICQTARAAAPRSRRTALFALRLSRRLLLLAPGAPVIPGPLGVLLPGLHLRHVKPIHIQFLQAAAAYKHFFHILCL